MNKLLFCYKTRFLTTILLISYAYLHIRLTGYYADATLDKFIDFSVRLPFGQRILVPAIAHFIAQIIPLDPVSIFFLLEILFATLLYLALYHLLAAEFSAFVARLLSWLFFFLLPLISVVNYRFTIDGVATFYYPYDTSSLFFTAVGFLLCLRAQWPWLIILLAVATCNRESALLIALMIPALHWQNLNKVIKPFGVACLTWLGIRLIISFIFKDYPGEYLEWYFRQTNHTHFETNLIWLLNEQNLLFFIFCLAGLPLFWFVFYDYIPSQYRPLRYVAFFYFIVLLLIGNLMETRIFGEIVILLYLPVCVALQRWVAKWQPEKIIFHTPLFYINRYCILVGLFLIALARQPLNQCVIWLANFL